MNTNIHQSGGMPWITARFSVKMLIRKVAEVAGDICLDPPTVAFASSKQTSRRIQTQGLRCCTALLFYYSSGRQTLSASVRCYEPRP